MSTFSSILFLTFGGCAVGPDYVRPVVEEPADWKDFSLHWKVADPSDGEAKAEWWGIFPDERLATLIQDLETSNQDLLAASERVAQARALLRVARGEFFPDIGLDGRYQRQETSETRAFFPGFFETVFETAVQLSYEIDVWGRIRRQSEAANADLASREADFENARLLLKAELADAYFELRALERELVIVDYTVATRKKNVRLVKNQLDAGGANRLDYSRALGEQTDVEADRELVLQRRELVRNAIAVLIAKPASEFSLEVAPIKDLPPLPQKMLPSALLERRPDVASAERALMAASAEIGVAKAAFYPTFSLVANFGYSSAEIDELLKAPSRFWSVGPGFTLPLFRGGRNRAELSRAEHRYLETVAEYRQSVIRAVQEVQDALASLHFLRRRVAKLEATVSHYRLASELSKDRFVEGLVSYFEVVDAQRRQLDFERELAQVRGDAHRAAVSLVKALGGGYQAPGELSSFSTSEQFKMAEGT